MLVADSGAMSCHLLADALERSEHYHAVAASTPKKVLQLLEKERFEVIERLQQIRNFLLEWKAQL